MKTFIINDRDEEKLKRWQQEHECKFRTETGYRYVGAVGGADSFTFTPTGIGTFVTVKCACGAELRFDDV